MIKYGGHAMADDALRAGFSQDVVFLRYAGLRPVVVHGGGPQISAHLARLGVPSTFTAGLRVTTPETMDVVRMVLTGQVNRDVVGLINRHGPFAVGMSGEDANMFTARKRHAVVDGTPVDIGLVGEIESVDPAAACALISDGRIPVVSSVARGTGGEVYNVNADTAAAALAVALGAAKLVVLTDVAGLFANWPGDGDSPDQPPDVISQLTATGPRWRRACAPCAVAFRRRTSWTVGCRTRCCWRSSPTPASAPWSYRTEQPHDSRRPVDDHEIAVAAATAIS